MQVLIEKNLEISLAANPSMDCVHPQERKCTQSLQRSGLYQRSPRRQHLTYSFIKGSPLELAQFLSRSDSSETIAHKHSINEFYWRPNVTAGVTADGMHAYCLALQMGNARCIASGPRRFPVHGQFSLGTGCRRTKAPAI
jgi:hypothetical protein